MFHNSEFNLNIQINTSILDSSWAKRDEIANIGKIFFNNRIKLQLVLTLTNIIQWIWINNIHNYQTQCVAIFCNTFYSVHKYYMVSSICLSKKTRCHPGPGHGAKRCHPGPGHSAKRCHTGPGHGGQDATLAPGMADTMPPWLWARRTRCHWSWTWCTRCHPIFFFFFLIEIRKKKRLNSLFIYRLVENKKKIFVHTYALFLLSFFSCSEK